MDPRRFMLLPPLGVRLASFGVRVVPEVFFRTARAPRPQVLAAAPASARADPFPAARVVRSFPRTTATNDLTAALH